tara:strand:+ start:353 stop:580 length:228 start_codon:yes stop_codon:yes gene_type:complete
MLEVLGELTTTLITIILEIAITLLQEFIIDHQVTILIHVVIQGLLLLHQEVHRVTTKQVHQLAEEKINSLVGFSR